MSKAFPEMTVEALTAARKGAMKIGPFGSQLRKEEMVEQGFKVYGQENVISNDWSVGDRRISRSKFRGLSTCELEPGDLVVSMMGTAGKCAVFTTNAERGIMDSHLLRVQPNLELVDRNYFAVALQAENVVGRQVAAMSHGSIMAGLSSKIVKRFKVPLPPLDEQPKIVAVLTALDTAMHETEAIIAKLKAVKQGLLHDLLTRGIDANGELRPSQAEAPHRYKDSPLGWMPKEWDVVTLESVSKTVTSGSRDWARFYADSGPLFVRIGNLTREHINFRYESTIHVRPPRNADGQRTRLESNDILISITADLGIVGVVPDGFGEAYINQHIALVRPDLDAVNSRFVGHYLAGPIAQTYISKLNDAGAKAGLNLPTIRGLVTAKPLRGEQDLIATRLDEIDNRIQNATAEFAKLRELKVGLTDDLLTGRVRVTPLLHEAA